MSDSSSFLTDLAARESRGSYTIVNSIGFLGKYQMGEEALVDAGYYTKDGSKKNDWVGTWSGKNGVTSKADFLNSPEAQESAIREYMSIQWGYITSRGLDAYVGTTLADGTQVTASGLLAGAHLKGAGGLERYIKSNGLDDNADKYGTRISSYVSKFSGYDVVDLARGTASSSQPALVKIFGSDDPTGGGTVQFGQYAVVDYGANVTPTLTPNNQGAVLSTNYPGGIRIDTAYSATGLEKSTTVSLPNGNQIAVTSKDNVEVSADGRGIVVHGAGMDYYYFNNDNPNNPKEIYGYLPTDGSAGFYKTITGPANGKTEAVTDVAGGTTATLGAQGQLTLTPESGGSKTVGGDYGGFTPPPALDAGDYRAALRDPQPSPLAENPALNLTTYPDGTRAVRDADGQFVLPVLNPGDRLSFQDNGRIVTRTAQNGDTFTVDTATGVLGIGNAGQPTTWYFPDAAPVQSSTGLTLDPTNNGRWLTATDGSTHWIGKDADGTVRITHESSRLESFGGSEPILTKEIVETALKTNGESETRDRVEAGGLTLKDETTKTDTDGNVTRSETREAGGKTLQIESSLDPDSGAWTPTRVVSVDGHTPSEGEAAALLADLRNTQAATDKLAGTATDSSTLAQSLANLGEALPQSADAGGGFTPDEVAILARNQQLKEAWSEALAGRSDNIVEVVKVGDTVEAVGASGTHYRVTQESDGQTRWESTTPEGGNRVRIEGSDSPALELSGTGVGLKAAAGTSAGELLGTERLPGVCEAPTATAPSSDLLTSFLQTLRGDAGTEDAAVLEVAEIRAIGGAQGANEAWGGGRLLHLADSALGDYYRINDANPAAVSPLLLDNTETQGLGLIGGYDLGNGGGIVVGEWSCYPDAGGSDNYTPGDGGYTPGDYGYDYSGYTYDPGSYSYDYSYNDYDYDTGGDWGGGWDDFWPVALDLDNDGVELVSKADSRAHYDITGDGTRHQLGWVAPDDAFLAIDDNHDGKISQAKELSFAQWSTDPNDTDLEALGSVFDTNHDGRIDAADARFADLRVLQR